MRSFSVINVLLFTRAGKETITCRVDVLGPHRGLVTNPPACYCAYKTLL